MGRRDSAGDGRMHWLSEDEKIPRWSVTWTWPASMAARLGGGGCCWDVFLPGLLLPRRRRRGGETGASRLAMIGVVLLFSWLHSVSAGGLGLASGSRVRFMMLRSIVTQNSYSELIQRKSLGTSRQLSGLLIVTMDESLAGPFPPPKILILPRLNSVSLPPSQCP